MPDVRFAANAVIMLGIFADAPEVTPSPDEDTKPAAETAPLNVPVVQFRAPALKVPDVEILVEPNVPTEKVPVVRTEAANEAAGSETDPAETVRPLEAVREPAATMLPVAEMLLLKVAVPEWDVVPEKVPVVPLRAPPLMLPEPAEMLLLFVEMVVQVSAPNVLAPAPSVPVVERFVEPNVPTENVPVVRAEAASEAAGNEIDPAETVRPFDDVSPPAAERPPDKNPFFQVVFDDPKS